MCIFIFNANKNGDVNNLISIFTISASVWIFPFLTLYLKSLGLTTKECSIIFGTMPILSGMAKMVFGAVADKFQKHRQMSLLFCVLSPTIICCLLLVTPIAKNTPTSSWILVNVDQHCSSLDSGSVLDCILDTHSSQNDGKAFRLTNCTGNELVKTLSDITEARMDLKGTNAEDANAEAEASHCQLNCSYFAEEKLEAFAKNKLFGNTFRIIFLILASGYIFYASVWAFVYALVYAVLEENRNRFGRQRMWGTVACLITSVCTAIAMNKYGSVVPEISFTPCFIGYSAWFVIAGIAAMFFKPPHIPRNPAMAKDLWKLIKQPQIFLLLFVLVIMGFMYGAMDTFLLMYLKGMGASSWVLGTCMFAQYVAELPALYYCGRIIKKIGHVRCLYLVLIAYSIRFLGTSLIPNPWCEIPFSMLRSVGFSIGFTAVSVYTSLITPPSMHATLQALMQTTHYGIGTNQITRNGLS